MSDLPDVFCWTRFGTEAGEPVTSILERKEAERREGLGVFLWGIGTSIAPGLRALLAQTDTPEVLFSPIKSKPRKVDVSPTSTVRWQAGITMDGQRVEIPTSGW